jgi:uncharacterized protein
MILSVRWLRISLAYPLRHYQVLTNRKSFLMVYAKSEDIARLIGRQGSMATAIRHMMSIPSRIEDKKIAIKFESY